MCLKQGLKLLVWQFTKYTHLPLMFVFPSSKQLIKKIGIYLTHFLIVINPTLC